MSQDLAGTWTLLRYVYFNSLSFVHFTVLFLLLFTNSKYLPFCNLLFYSLVYSLFTYFFLIVFICIVFHASSV